MLIAISTAITLVVAEYAFRKVLFSDSNAFKSIRYAGYYSGHLSEAHEEFFNETFWKLNYLFNRSFNITSPHPLLGWVGSMDMETLQHHEAGKMNGRRPVLLYGDSFAQCVDSTICFDEYLNRDSVFTRSHYLLNFGVGGYGVDQTYLMFRETAPKFQNPFVIFSLLTTDMDRCMLGVRDAQKPFFKLERDSLVLRGTPITLSSEAYFEENPPRITSYLWQRLKSSRVWPFKQDEADVQSYIDDMKRLNKAILESAFRELNRLNIDFVVLIFHPEHHPADEWRLGFIREVCESNNVPYLLDREIRNEEVKDGPYDPHKYAIKGDGHPTSYSNILVSDIIKELVLLAELRNRMYIDPVPGNQLGLLLSISDYKKYIYENADWLSHVREKAASRNMSLDTMVMMDALYMAAGDNKKK